MNHDTSIWNRLDTLEQQELDTLVSAALTVLKGQATDARLQKVDELPRRIISREIAEAFEEAHSEIDPDAADSLVREPAKSHAVAIATLQTIAREPELAAEIERVYDARRGMMVIEGGVVLGPALLLLVLKLKRIRIGRSGLDVQFYDADANVVSHVPDLLQ